MTLKQLYYFLKITETGNLTKASKILHMSQPPLSYQLRMLEEELGVTLFVRDARNMQITPEGLYLKDMAIQILGLVDKTIEGVKNISAETSTTINIGMSANSNYNLLPNVIKAFQKKYPNAGFNFYDGTDSHLLEMLNNQLIDVAILRSKFNKSIYEYKKIQTGSELDSDHFVAIGTDAYLTEGDGVISTEELFQCPLILHRRYEDLIDSIGQEHKLTPNIICKNDNITTSVEWAINGLGVAIMPASSAQMIPSENIIIRPIDAESFSADPYIVWLNPETVLMKDFIALF